jgi:predicted ribosome quality control (RQC) complex YloA/Tae2 family protein
VSNAIDYDPLLVRHLAEELDRELRGRACAAAPIFSAGLTATLPLEGGRALRLDLHPDRGWVRLVPWNDDSDELDAVCLGADSRPDERTIEIRLRTADRFRVGERRLVLELQTNQWNAILVTDPDSRVLTALRSRRAGGRLIRPGHPYEVPPPRHRYGAGAVAREEAETRWLEVLSGVEPADRRGKLLAEFAYAGGPNAAAILGAAGTARDGEAESSLIEAFERWWRLRASSPASPVVLRTRRGEQPYPFALEGVEARPVESLLAGMAEIAESEPEPGVRDVERELLTRRVDGRVAAAERKIDRLEEELARGGEVDRLRSFGDLLLANLRLVPRGAERVRLMGWEREIVEIDLDPSLDPAENAARWYDAARRRERADRRLPALLADARNELARWREARESVETGGLPAWAERDLERSTRTQEGGGSSEQEQARPYRVYHTSGGLEARVGRSAKDNDRLTFGNSAPNDIWLHARSVAGSHVILRWTDTEASPPARDLEEAATLAALYSKARTSSLVPVDWTRRKHVRKPRGAPPGAVIPQRVKTVFVTPDESVEERLRE